MIWRWFWREWKTPSLLIVWIALSLSVACVLSLGKISDRLTQGLNLQNREFLAGDRVLRASKPVPEAWLEQATQRGVTVSRQLSFMTMTYAGEQTQLASVKAVEMSYPLYGKLETKPEGVKPGVGKVLVAPRLLALLNIKVGDRLEVGDAEFQVAGELLTEPDAGFNPFQTAPKILIDYKDIEKTGAVQPGSRLTYRYMFAGDEKAIERVENIIKPQLTSSQRWQGGADSEGAVGKSLERAHYFLLLSAVLTLLLSVASIAVSMGHYCRSRYDLIAVLKTLGAGRAALRKFIIGQWVMILILSAICGSLAGLSFEWMLLKALMPFMPSHLPQAGIRPWLWALGSLIAIALIVGVRPYKQLLATRPLRVLRNDVVTTVWPLRYYLPVILLITIILLALMAGFSLILWSLLAGLLVLALLLGVVGWLTLLLLRRLTVSSLAVRLAINRLLRRPWITASQLASFALSFMLLALLIVVRGDLLSRWQQQLPPESPNYFLLNISTEQVPEVSRFLQQHQIIPGDFYPIVQARLTQINGVTATDVVGEDAPGGGSVNRELNLTWREKAQDYSPVTEGTWPPKADEVSMEQNLAKNLGVKLGDTLVFTGDTKTFSVKVSSFRRVDWESLRPNFFFIFPPGVLENQPQTWITSFRHQGDNQSLVQLNREFPTVTVLDIGAMIQQIGRVLQQVGKALEVMVVLVLVCGFLLLLAQLQVGMRQRQKELIVYRTLGAGKKLLGKTLWYEFAILGLVSGLVAVFGAEIALWLLQSRIFDFPWEPNYFLWVCLPVVGALLLSCCGSGLGLYLLRGKALFRRYVE